MTVAKRDGAPVAIHIEFGSPNEVKLVTATRAACHPKRPKRLIGDKAHDSNGLDCEMATLGIVSKSLTRSAAATTFDLQ